MKHKLWIGLGAVCLLLLGFLHLAEQHEVKAGQQIELTFAQGKNQLAGTLLLPVGQGPFPVVLLVHGDGPQTRGVDRYMQIINSFLSAGIACFTWDKPGTGQSSGDWLQQTMQQRALETHAAMQMLAQRRDIQAQAIGLLGFSQGAWVVPEVAHMTPAPAFLITVGAALDWRTQGEFFTRQRLKRAGISPEDAERVIAWQNAAPQPAKSVSYAEFSRDFQKYRTAVPAPIGANAELLSAERYQFIALNIEANSSQNLATLPVPLLAVWGKEDLNVDAMGNAQAFTTALKLPKNPQHRVVVMPQADHTMLNSSVYSMQLPSEWTWWMTVRYFFSAKAAFAPEFLPLIINWATKHSTS
ncbi:MAG: alpha/beta hydrolase family protein [Deefgea sp.]